MNVYTNLICILFFCVIVFENVIINIDPFVRFIIIFASGALMLVQAMWMIALHIERKRDMDSYIMAICIDVIFHNDELDPIKGEYKAVLESVVISVKESKIVNRFDAEISLRSIENIQISKTKGKAEAILMKDYTELRKDNELQMKMFSNYLKESENLYKTLHVITDDGYNTCSWASFFLVTILGEQTLDYSRSGKFRRIYTAEDYFRGYNKIPMASEESSKDTFFNDHFLEILHYKEDENEISITSSKRAAFLAKLYNYTLHLWTLNIDV